MIINQHVFFGYKDDADSWVLRLFLPDLPEEIAFINSNRITRLSLEIWDPLESMMRPRLDDGTYIKNMRKLRSDVDLSPISSCSQLTELHLEGNFINANCLSLLPNLTTLSVDNDLSKKKTIDLGGLKRIETLWVNNYHKNVIGWDRLPKLKSIRFWKYAPSGRDLSAFRHLCSLENLELIQPRIDTLNGIEHCGMLRSVSISYCRTLLDISSINQCEHDVKLILDHTPRVVNNVN